MSHLFAV